MSPQDFSDEELVQAHKQVRAFMHVLDLSDSDIRQWKQDMHWLQDHRKKFDGLGDKIAATVVGAASFAILLAVWEGLKHFLHK
jgi:2-keto-4-pentenoate hydratase/2-oxohepta-3-ene-1,7-dioic acid hydratase in catechol pathway